MVWRDKRSSPFPFKLKEGFRKLWKQLAVRFDGRHCGMRTLSMRRSPPASSKLLRRFGLSRVADCPAVSRRPPQGWRPRSEVCGYRPADRTNEAVDKPRVSGILGGGRESFLVCLAGEQRVQQEPTNTPAYFMATDGMFLPSAEYFTPYQRLCFLYLKFIRGHWG